MTTRPGTGNPALNRALGYAGRGWPVFPCRPGSKEPATTHGHLDATTNPAIITAWWKHVPDRNVAIATGAPGPDVLDIDVRPDGTGYPAWNTLQNAGLSAGTLAIIRTPSGGLHAYYPGTRQRSHRIPAQHLDFKAAGGYVLAPPSKVGGATYQVLRRPSGEQSSLDWAAVSRLLLPERETRHPARAAPADPGRLAAWVSGLKDGNRHDGLFWAACRAVENGHLDGLDAIADAARTTGLPDPDIRRTFASAIRTVRLAADGNLAAHRDAEAEPEAGK